MYEHDLGFLCNHLARLLRHRMAESIAHTGLTPQQAALLLNLSDGPATRAELSAVLGMDRPTMTGVSERLEQGGWIVSAPHPTDGRARLLWLTSRGELVLPALREAAGAVSERALGALPAEDVPRVLGALEAMAASLETDR